MTKASIRLHGLLSSILSRVLFPVVMAFGFFVSGNAHAQYTNVYWNPTNGLGGTGTNNSANTNWSTNSTIGGGTLVPYQTVVSGVTNTFTNYIYNFSGPSGTVTINSSQTIGGINVLSSGYVWSSGSVRTFTATDTSTSAGQALTIASGANLTITGSGFAFDGLAVSGGAGATMTLSNNSTTTPTVARFGSSSATGGRTNSVNTILSGTGTNIIGISGTSTGVTQQGNVSNNVTGAGMLVFSNGSTSSSGDIIVAGVISGSGPVSLVLNLTNGPNNIFLNASNSYSGGTTIFNTNGGYIGIRDQNAFGLGAITIAGAGTNYIRNFASGFNVSNSLIINNGSTLRIATTNSGWKGTYSGVISGGGGIITRFTDTQIIAGTNNSFGGGINIASGTKVQVASLGTTGANSSLGTNGVITFSSDSGAGAAGELYWLGANSEASDKNFALTTVSSASGAGMKLYAGASSSGGTNVTLTLNGNIISTGATNLTVTLGTYNSNSLVVNGTINQTAGYTNSLVVTNSDANGSVVLSGNNSYGGNTTINGGSLTLNGANTGAGTVIMKALCFLRLGHTNALINGTLAGASSSANTPTLNLTVAGNHTVAAYGNTVDQGWNMSFTNSSGSPATLTFTAPTNYITVSSTTSGGRSLTNQSTNLTVIFNGAVDIGGTTNVDTTFAGPGNFTILGSLFNINPTNSRALTKTGAGTLTLSASNSYNGVTTISAGTLVLNAAGALGTNNVTLSGTLRTTAAGTNESTGNLTVTGNSTIDLGTVNTGVLRFATATGWTAGRTLTITNSSGGARLYILNTSGLDTTQIKSAENPTASASFASDGLLTFSVAKQTPTITVTPGTYTYNGSMQGPGVGEVNTGGSTGAVTLSYVGANYGPTSTPPTNAGSYTVTASVAADDNYNAASSAATSFAIQPQTLAENAITITPPPSLVYDRSPKSHTASSPGINGFSLSYVGRAGTIYNESATAPTLVGDYTVTATDTDPNYTGSRSGDFSITARALTVTADPKSKTANTSDPSLTYQVTSGSLISGDSFSGALTRDSGENAGTYAINQGTLSAGSNYAITYIGANLTINPSGPTFESAYGGVSLTNVAPNGLTYLVNYAFGGDSSNAPTLPTLDVSDPTKLVLVAVVRTNDTSVSVTGESVIDLVDYGNPSKITGIQGDTNGVSQTYLPAGCERRKYSVDQGTGERKFLRLKVSK